MLTAERHGDDSQDVATRLEWRPQLSFLQEALCFSAAALFCCGFYALTAPATISLVYSTLVALMCSSIIAVLRYSMLEAMFRYVPWRADCQAASLVRCLTPQMECHLVSTAASFRSEFTWTLLQ
jgi:hypothetical protein